MQDLRPTLPRSPDDAPVVMGILNVTPDSFSDGGRYVDVDTAVAHGLRMAREGAAVIDVGGESTRPGAPRIDADEQQRRAVSVIAALRNALDAGRCNHVAISIDTTLAPVAAAALGAGASIVNDVSACREDRAMLPLVAERGAVVVLMHMLGEPGTMQDAPTYGDVVAEVASFLLARARAAESAGVSRERIVLDPGIGFGKTLEHNFALLASLDRLADLGYPALLGASRKRFIADASPMTAEAHGSPRLGGTVAATVLGYAAGVRLFRVHDVLANRQALDVASAVAEAGHEH